MNREQEKIYEDGFIAGMQKQMQSSVDKAVNRMAQRSWVGLTPEEIWDSTYGLTRIQKDDWVATDADLIEFAHIIEAKLKEKNT